MTDENGSPWVVVPNEIARLHPLYGVGGWLWLVAFGCAAGPAAMLLTLRPRHYAAIDYAALPLTVAALLIAELVITLTSALWSLGTLFLLFNKHRWFPKSLAGMLIFAVVALSLDAVANKITMASVGRATSWTELFTTNSALSLAGAIVRAAVWLPYSFFSRRVNITYLNRARADDRAISEKAAEFF